MLACWENCLVCVGVMREKIEGRKNIWGRENRNNSALVEVR